MVRISTQEEHALKVRTIKVKGQISMPTKIEVNSSNSRAQEVRVEVKAACSRVKDKMFRTEMSGDSI